MHKLSPCVCICIYRYLSSSILFLHETQLRLFWCVLWQHSNDNDKRNNTQSNLVAATPQHLPGVNEKELEGEVLTRGSRTLAIYTTQIYVYPL